MDNEGKRILLIYLRILITAVLSVGAFLLCGGNGSLGIGILGALLICCTSILLYRLKELRKTAAETQKQLQDTTAQLLAVQKELKLRQQSISADKFRSSK